MKTNEQFRKNYSTFIEMKSPKNTHEHDQQIEQLERSIISSIDKLKQLRNKIQAENNLKRLVPLMAEFEKQTNLYKQFHKSLGQINESSEVYQRIKKINKDFIEIYNPAELKKKFDYMKAEQEKRIKTENSVEMAAINEEQLSGQLLYADKHAVRYKILMQEKQELVEIERLINQIKDIATKTSIMINTQGEKLQLTLEKMKKNNKDIKGARVLVTEANQYQQDTNKTLMAFCCLVAIIVSIIVVIIYSSHKKT